MDAKRTPLVLSTQPGWRATVVYLLLKVNGGPQGEGTTLLKTSNWSPKHGDRVVQGIVEEKKRWEE